MPSSFAHAAAGLAVASVFAPGVAPRRYWVTAAMCAVIPDLDYIGAPFGNPTIALMFGGHRGFTHSIAFGVLLGVAAVWAAFRGPEWREHRVRLGVAFALATMTHGLFDALTDLGPPVAFFSPFSLSRYTFAWHPIHPSGVSPARGFARLPAVLGNEFLWVGIPAAGVALAARWYRRPLSFRA